MNCSGTPAFPPVQSGWLVVPRAGWLGSRPGDDSGGGFQSIVCEGDASTPTPPPRCFPLESPKTTRWSQASRMLRSWDSPAPNVRSDHQPEETLRHRNVLKLDPHRTNSEPAELESVGAGGIASALPRLAENGFQTPRRTGSRGRLLVSSSMREPTRSGSVERSSWWELQDRESTLVFWREASPGLRFRLSRLGWLP